jgi:hypothetical protein
VWLKDVLDKIHGKFISMSHTIILNGLSGMITNGKFDDAAG